MIPVEPMYMIFNLGMSKDFGEVDIDNLPFPSYMMIDNIRVYQRPDKVNVGCNPPGFKTSQWIACNKEKYITNKEDEVLFAACESAAARQLTSSLFLVLFAILFTKTTIN